MTTKELGLETISREQRGSGGYRCVYRAETEVAVSKGVLLRDEDINRQFTVPEDMIVYPGHDLEINFLS